ncbi:unnamed protein product [Bemisia tabaci]|uniref:Exportin-5 n=1 Tax=Bemisia tabaci TaxID=7038 RepID=A0A9P0AGP7_BEMTA|nr:unnamed protein product [Bemisia tabaci]
MNEEILAVAQQLIYAVELSVNPLADQQARAKAYHDCEVFKEESPVCFHCGLYLAQRQDLSPTVRHFGLQLIEHCIKYKWYDMQQKEKLFLKENIMELLGAGMEPLPAQNSTLLQNALSRVIVEMIKREWPQQWPTLLQELHGACNRGCPQTEIVLLIFLRLVEDVAQLQNLESAQRRKDIYQALTTYMADIFTFFMDLISKHHSLATASQGHPVGQQHIRIVQLILETLCGFVDWVSITHVISNDGRLLQTLCLLLIDPNFQNQAAECLLEIVSRKGKLEERKPLMILFSHDALTYINEAVKTCQSMPISEKSYLFIKNLTKVLHGMSTQLCSIWGKEDGCNGHKNSPNSHPISRPDAFGVYMQAVVAFSKHPSLTIVHLINPIWNSFLKHDSISKDPVFLTFLPEWVDASASKLIKMVYPAVRLENVGHESLLYAVLDYDSEEEFNSFFFRSRTDFLETFRQATLVAPLITYGYAEKWLFNKIQNAVNLPKEPLTLQSPEYLEWEAVSMLLDSVLSKIVMCSERPPVSNGILLLDQCLALTPSDPLILSCLLSCISALFVFLSMSPVETTKVYLPRTLDKIFETLIYPLPAESDKETRQKAVNLRRHAASLLVKISQKYPLLLLPLFDVISVTITNLRYKTAQLLNLEFTCLMEASLLISNHFCDYERQTKIVEELITPFVAPWLTICKTSLTNPMEFMNYIGLNMPPYEDHKADPNFSRRSQIWNIIEVLLAITRRCVWPDDPDKALKGGFLVGLTESGNPIYRNPAASHVLPLLPGVFNLLHVLHSLWTPQAVSLIPEGYRGATDMLESDKNYLLGLTTSSEIARMNSSPCFQMQNFLATTYDLSCHILSCACQNFGYSFYQIQDLSATIINVMLSNLENVPDYRLRIIIRAFLKSLIISCPSMYYESVLMPVLSHFTPFMCERLSLKWELLRQMRESGKIDDNDENTQELLEDMLNRQLTREYLDVVKIILYGGSGTEKGSLDDAMDGNDSSQTPPQPTSSLHPEVISELGIKVMRNSRTCQGIAQFMLRCLTWCDSTNSLKVCSLMYGMVRQLHNDKHITPPFAACIMETIFHALELHGQHDANLGSLQLLGTQLYELLRPKHPEILEVLKSIPNVHLVDIQKFDERMLKETSKGSKVDKSKREMFKKITQSLVGCNLGQKFRRKAAIRELPRISVPPRNSVPSLLDSSVNGSDLNLMQLFHKP